MQRAPPDKRFRLFVVVAVVVIGVIVVSVVFYRLYSANPTSDQIVDSQNDVALNLGVQYPGMIDVVDAVLHANSTKLHFTIDLKDSVSALGEGEYAQWNITLLLWNDSDVVNAYEVCVEMNSTVFSGYFVQLGDENATACQAYYYGNSVTVFAAMDDLASAKAVEWSILTTYEKYSGDELIVQASDIAPDEGYQKTVVTP